ncbi:MAG TPA: hypothetical protein VKR05_02030 [Candidatus Cybelea sp.]|nr:hypothetical protein [Candidatus Cybelea sp.]
MLRLALFFTAILVLYDALTATIAKAIGISYDSFLVLAWVLLLLMGVLAGRKYGWLGLIPLVVTAALEATAGWYVAAAIGPGYVPGWTMRMLVALALERALLSIAIGAAGVFIGRRSLPPSMRARGRRATNPYV